MASPTIPGYERLSQIGKGGFSRVYSGEQAKLKRQVAIKVLNFGLSDEADRRSFERECELMGRVSTHPNIVTVHDTAFTANGQPCIVMEHYPGGSIANLITDVGRLMPREALEVGVAIAGALEASHQAGVLHCDLKPQNILVSEFGQPALGDFGISTFSEERTRTGSDTGAGFTLAYAAPEIVEGASPSVQSDLYSLAATLYTALAGRRPFYFLSENGKKPTAAEQARRILLDAPLSLVDEGVPAELDEVIRAAMAKDPAARPATAADFARTLFEVGRRLGFNTSAPRIADQGALAVPGSIEEAVAPEWDPAKQQELLDLTELKPIDQTALRVDMPRPQLEPEPAVSNRRRLLAPVIGLLGVLALAGIVYTVTQGESEPEVNVTPALVETPGAEQVVFPPPVPQGVRVTRVGSDSMLVSWSNLPDETVTYEIRLDSREEPLVATSMTSPVVIEVDADEVPCVDLLAVRGGRLTPAPGRRCISPRLREYVEVSPSECSMPCDIGVELSGFGASLPVEVSVERLGPGPSDEEPTVAATLTDADGQIPTWSGSFDEEGRGSGTYLVTVTDQTSSQQYRSFALVNAVADE